MNKLKFRISFEENSILKLELLIAAEYDINIIINQLKAYKPIGSTLFLALLLVGQLVAQAFGAYLLYEESTKRINIISPMLPRVMIGLDFTKLIILTYLFLNNEVTPNLFSTFRPFWPCRCYFWPS